MSGAITGLVLGHDPVKQERSKLDSGERVESLFLGAGSTRGGHDLVTDRRGCDAARQSHLFIDLVNLASADTDKICCMYMAGIEAPLRFLKGRRSLDSGAVVTRFRELHGDKYATVGDYYKSVADHVAIIDLIKILPILADVTTRHEHTYLG